MSTLTTTAGTGSLLIRRAGHLLDRIDAVGPFPSLVRRQPPTEAWFSDHLAWLLDPQAGHGFGTRFADEFLKLVARTRTAGHPDENHRYNHRQQFLRWGRTAVRGTLSTHFDLRNAAVFREFYLAQAARSGRKNEGMLCDVVLLDLDLEDGLFVAIENKLFTTNARGQLERYYRTIEERYRRARVLEYVYLTLFGDPPRHATSARSRLCTKTWVRVSWVDDILPLIESLQAAQPSPEVRPLLAVLRWVRAAWDGRHREEATALVHDLLEELVAAAAEILVDELGRLSEGAPGDWRVVRRGRARTRILHSSKPTAPLYVGVLPNLSVLLWTQQRGRKRHDKLLVPFGSNADQIENLLDLMARDVYPLHFGDGFARYLGGARRVQGRGREVRKRHRPFFEFVHKRRHALRMLVPLVGLGGGCSVLVGDGGTGVGDKE